MSNFIGHNLLLLPVEHCSVLIFWSESFQIKFHHMNCKLIASMNKLIFQPESIGKRRKNEQRLREQINYDYLFIYFWWVYGHGRLTKNKLTFILNGNLLDFGFIFLFFFFAYTMLLLWLLVPLMSSTKCRYEEREKSHKRHTQKFSGRMNTYN